MTPDERNRMNEFCVEIQEEKDFRCSHQGDSHCRRRCENRSSDTRARGSVPRDSG